MAYEPSQSEIDQYGYVRAKIRANNNPRRAEFRLKELVVSAFMRAYDDILVELGVDPFTVPPLEVEEIGKNAYRIGPIPFYLGAGLDVNVDPDESGYYVIGIGVNRRRAAYGYTPVYYESSIDAFTLAHELSLSGETESSLATIARRALLEVMNGYPRGNFE